MEQNTQDVLQQIAENALQNSVVRLDVERDVSLLSLRPQYNISKTSSSNGSGFFIEKNLIVTNCHVILGATSVSVKLENTEDTFQIESVKAYDYDNDLIVLKVTSAGIPLKLGDSDKIEKRTPICAPSYAKGAADIAHGTIHGIGRKDNRIQMKIGTTGGSSGCPFINRQGEVIGIDASGNDKYSYAIPSNTLKSLMHESTEEIPYNMWQELPHICALSATEIGDDMLGDDEYKEAIAYFENALTLKPDIADAYKGRATARMSLGMFSRAMEDYLTARKLNSQLLSSSGFWSFLFWKSIVLAHFLVKAFRSLFDDSSWSRLRGIFKTSLSKSYVKDGSKTKAEMLLKEAINDFTDAINLKHDEAQNYNGMGWAKYRLGQLKTDQGNEIEAKELYREAISDSEKALQLEQEKLKHRAAYYHTRAVAKAGLGNHDKAVEDLNICIKLNSEKALYFYDRACSKAVLELHEDAETDFTKARQLDPDIEKRAH